MIFIVTRTWVAGALTADAPAYSQISLHADLAAAQAEAAATVTAQCQVQIDSVVTASVMAPTAVGPSAVGSHP